MRIRFLSSEERIKCCINKNLVKLEGISAISRNTRFPSIFEGSLFSNPLSERGVRFNSRASDEGEKNFESWTKLNEDEDDDGINLTSNGKNLEL